MRKHSAILLSLLFVFVFLQGTRSVMGGNISVKNDGRTSVEVKENTYSNLTITNSLTDISYFTVSTSEGTFTELTAEGYNSTIRVGSPKLPVMNRLIEIPWGASVSVTVVPGSFREFNLADLGLAGRLMPTQPPIPKTGGYVPKFKLDQAAYSVNSFYPNSLYTVTDLGVMRGIRVARLTLSPVQYNPVTGKLRVYGDLTVKVNFGHADVARTLYEKQRNYSPFFTALNSQLLNYKPAKVLDTITHYPVKYVIVADPMFESTLQTFVQWKTKKGFNVIQAYTSNPQVGTTTTSIKNYLQNLYNSATPQDPAPSFILFVGDIQQLPAWNGTTGSQVTDLYYAEYTGDFLPEVYYGRFSAQNASQLGPQIQKTLEYEQYQMPDPVYLNEVVMIAGVDAGMAPTYGNGQINYGTNNYFNLAHGLTSHTYLYPASASAASQIIQNVSNGVGYANYTAHGSSSGWADPSFSVSNVASLQNLHKYPLMVGNCCLTNKFDDPVCFGEALLRADGKGALGYIGGTNVTYWDEDFYWGCGAKTISANPVYSANALGAYDRTFHDHGEPASEWYVTQEEMNFGGCLAVTQGSSMYDYYWEIYTLMGDPSLMVYFSVPPAMAVSYAGLMPLASTSFTVNAEPYAYVAISKDGVLYGAALADALGTAVVPLTPITVPGTADVVVTKQNRQPFISTVVVASPTGPYVLMQNVQIMDPTGNNDGKADFGETIQLNMTLKNVGLSLASGVTATLSTTDPFITITTGTHSWGNIVSGDSLLQAGAFVFSIANDIPDQHSVTFNLLIQDGPGDTWNSTFHVVVNAPDIAIGNFTIADPLGSNPNGHLDPGETANFLVKTFNNGHSTAPNPLATLNTLSPYIILNSTSASIASLSPGTNHDFSFNVTVSPTAPVGITIPLDYSVVSGQYSAQKTFVPMVGLVVEDWETGTFTKFNWIQGGNGPWTITLVSPYEGSYCAKSGAINDMQTSELSLDVDVLNDDSISFYRKVSSESTYDFLRFYIDGNQQGEWSGNMAWARQAYPIATGPHTLKWAYEKDYSMTSGSDCAWLDYIKFPSISGVISSLPSESSVDKDFSVYPNPFSGKTNLTYTLDKRSTVSLKIYDAIGTLVKDLSSGLAENSGAHSVTFDASGLGKGIYYGVLSAGNLKITKKLVLFK